MIAGEDEAGYGQTYFIRCTATGLIKIGHTTGSVESRFAALQTGSASELVLVGTVPGGREVEQELHRRFAADRVRGEWFRMGRDMYLYACRNLSPSWKVAGSGKDLVEMLESLGFTVGQFLDLIESGDLPWPPWEPGAYGLAEEEFAKLASE